MPEVENSPFLSIRASTIRELVEPQPPPSSLIKSLYRFYS